MPTRRRFLLNCTAMAMAAALSPGSLMAGDAPGAARLLEGISLAEFAGMVGTEFRARGASGRMLALRLVEVKLHKPARHTSATPEDDANEKFALRFMGPADEALSSDGTLAHPHLGEFEIFVTPAGRKAGEEQMYEACFNRPSLKQL